MATNPSPAAVTDEPVLVGGAEIERLRAELRRVEGELGEVTEERDRLQQEVNQYEVDMETRVDIDRGQRAALAHGRAVIESAEASDSFTRTMNERAVDAISELLGDR